MRNDIDAAGLQEFIQAREDMWMGFSRLGPGPKAKVSLGGQTSETQPHSA